MKTVDVQGYFAKIKFRNRKRPVYAAHIGGTTSDPDAAMVYLTPEEAMRGGVRRSKNGIYDVVTAIPIKGGYRAADYQLEPSPF